MDWDHIEQLLNIGKLSAEHGPRYTPIVSAVQLELEEHLAEAKKVVEDKAKAEVEEFNRKKADAVSRTRKEEEEAFAFKPRPNLESKIEPEQTSASSDPAIRRI